MCDFQNALYRKEDAGKEEGKEDSRAHAGHKGRVKYEVSQKSQKSR